MGSVFVEEALRRATELTLGAYARTSERSATSCTMLTSPKRKKGIPSGFNIFRVKKSLSEGALRPTDLLAHFKQTQSTSRTRVRVTELLDNTVELIREMVDTHNLTQTSRHGMKLASNKLAGRFIRHTCLLIALFIIVVGLCGGVPHSRF